MGTVTTGDGGPLNNGQSLIGLRHNFIESRYPLRPSRTPNAALMTEYPLRSWGAGESLDCLPVPYETEILGLGRRANGRVVTNCRANGESGQARETCFSEHKKSGAKLRRFSHCYYVTIQVPSVWWCTTLKRAS